MVVGVVVAVVAVVGVPVMVGGGGDSGGCGGGGFFAVVTVVGTVLMEMTGLLLQAIQTMAKNITLVTSYPPMTNCLHRSPYAKHGNAIPKGAAVVCLPLVPVHDVGA